METTPSTPPLPTTPVAPPAPGDGSAKVVYVLYLVSPVVIGVTAIIGAIIAYVNVGSALEPVRSHYRFQIRTFWLYLLYGIVGWLLWPVGIGAIAHLAVVVWLVIRCVKGLRFLDRRETYPNASTWLW